MDGERSEDGVDGDVEVKGLSGLATMASGRDGGEARADARRCGREIVEGGGGGEGGVEGGRLRGGGCGGEGDGDGSGGGGGVQVSGRERAVDIRKVNGGEGRVIRKLMRAWTCCVCETKCLWV